MRAQRGGDAFANARNAAAGTIRARNRPYTLEMTFFVFQAVELPGGEVFAHTSHADLMKWVAGTGIQTTEATPPKAHVVATMAEVQKQVAAIDAMCPSLPFDIDGVGRSTTRREPHAGLQPRALEAGACPAQRGHLTSAVLAFHHVWLGRRGLAAQQVGEVGLVHFVPGIAL
ncbi:hypothetical protein GCM10010327_42080 [Streptomyces nitrosporeus]|nr:hypothetical protein GCM10010327_42080 [Streptomyces nitrosporeus]